jgi:hypothetical protein
METNQIETTLPNEEEEPQVFSVAREVNGSQISRRHFIEKAVVTSAATSVVISGCSFFTQPVNTQATVDAAIAATENFKKAVVEAQQATNASAAHASTDTPVPAPPTDEAPTATSTPTPVQSTETPIPTATTAGIKSTIKGDNVNLRVGPGTGFPPITRLPAGTEVLLTSRLADSTWVGVSLSDPKKKGKTVLGWIKTSLVSVQIRDIASLPAITDIPPTPTPLPGKYGHTAVGMKGIDYEYTDEYGNTYPYTLPCGSTIPQGAICTCNCVTVERTGGCGCDDLHYWYPN